MASVCATCGVLKRSRPLRKGDPPECESCRKYRCRKGYKRPITTIDKHEHREALKANRGGLKLDSTEPESMTKERYVGPSQPANCSCGCGRLANPLDIEGRSKNCADLAWYRSQRAS